MKYLLSAIAVLTFAACAIPESDPAADDSADASFDAALGVQLWSFREKASADGPAEMLTMVRDMGLTHVETAGLYGMPADSFAAVLDEVGLEVTSMHVSVEELRNGMETVVANAQALGVRNVGTAWYPHESPFTEETARQAAAEFNGFGRELQAAGIRFFYHPHGYEPHPYGDETLLDLLIDETDPELVAFEMDVLWTWLPGLDPVEVIARHPGRFKLMHIKDMKPGLGRGSLTGGLPAEDQSVIGEGQVDWPTLLRAAEADGFEHFYLEDETTDPVVNAPRSVAYLEALRN